MLDPFTTNKINVHNAAQENVINACGEFVYSMLWLIRPKNKTTIRTMHYADNHLIGIPKKTVLLDGNKEQYQHTFSGTTGSGLGSLQVSTPLSRPIFVESY